MLGPQISQIFTDCQRSSRGRSDWGEAMPVVIACTDVWEAQTRDTEDPSSDPSLACSTTWASWINCGVGVIARASGVQCFVGSAGVICCERNSTRSRRSLFVRPFVTSSGIPDLPRARSSIFFVGTEIDRDFPIPIQTAVRAAVRIQSILTKAQALGLQITDFSGFEAPTSEERLLMLALMRFPEYIDRALGALGPLTALPEEILLVVFFMFVFCLRLKWEGFLLPTRRRLQQQFQRQFDQ